MIRAVAELDNGGMLILLGITEENVRRLRDDKPITLNLGELLVMALKGQGKRDRGKLELAIFYGATHRDLVADFRKAGVPISDEQVAEADAIDRSLDA